MSRRRHRKNSSQNVQERHGSWTCILSGIVNIVGHHLFGNWMALATLVVSIAGIIIGIWLNKSSNTGSLSNSGDDNNSILDNVSSSQSVEKMISAEKGAATITDVAERCAGQFEAQIPQLRNSSELDFLADNAFNAWKRMDFSNAVMNARCANKLMASHFPEDGSVINIYIESNVWLNVQRVYPVLIDDAMSNKDFDAMSHMADILIASTPSYWAYPQAMKDIANLRKKGDRLFFFSPERICELRKMPKRDLEQYLTFLTTRGYLAPYSLNLRYKDVDPVEWGEFFGLGHPLPYLDVFRVKSKDKDGNEITSNELYGQWVGLGRYELIDVNAEAARAIGLSESEVPQKPIRITGTITRGRPQAVLLAQYKRVQIPEPSSGILLLIGFGFLALCRRPSAAALPRLAVVRLLSCPLVAVATLQAPQR